MQKAILLLHASPFPASTGTFRCMQRIKTVVYRQISASKKKMFIVFADTLQIYLTDVIDVHCVFFMNKPSPDMKNI